MKRITVVVAAVAIVGVLGGCSVNAGDPAVGNQPASPGPGGSSVRAWKATNGDTFNSIISDLQSISTDVTNSDTSALGADCQQLGLDVTTGQGLPAIPDPTAQGTWTSLLSTLASASQSCVNGVAQNDQGLINQAGQEFATSATQINDLSQALGL